MKKVLFKLGVGLKKHAPTILAGLGCIGVVATAVVTGKAAIKAEQLLREAEEIKGCELTKKEAIVSQIPAYIVPMVTAGVTVAFIFGCNALNKKQQASLAAAAVSIEEAFRRYRNKVVETLGADMDKAVKDAIAEEAVQNADAPKYGEELFYDALTNEYFYSTMVAVQDAEYQANYDMQWQWGVSLTQWRGLLGLEHREEYDDIGWSGAMAIECGDVCWIDFVHEEKTRDDGVKYTILTTAQSPIFDYENYEDWERAKLYPSELTALEEFNLMQKKGAVA
jgi:hypothetical protein